MTVALGWLLAAAAVAQPVQLKVALDRPEITAGESVTVDVQLSWKGAQDAYSIEEWSAPERGGTPLLATGDQVTTAQEDGGPTYRRHATYLVRGEEAGTVTLSPARVVLKAAGGARQELKSQALGFSVRPARSPVSFELVLGLIALGLGGVAVRAAKRAAPPPPPPSRGQQAHQRAESLRSVGHRDHREFFDAVREALREGLAEVAPAAAREKDRERLGVALRTAGVGTDQCRAVEELVGLCDEARFNPEPPGADARERALSLLVTALS